eukprot:COSAG04_NODE_5243_length_1688_cov_9.159849_1_plen_53_part_10
MKEAKEERSRDGSSGHRSAGGHRRAMRREVGGKREGREGSEKRSREQRESSAK